jgi:hypothetical protein
MGIEFHALAFNEVSVLPSTGPGTSRTPRATGPDVEGEPSVEDLCLRHGRDAGGHGEAGAGEGRVRA